MSKEIPKPPGKEDSTPKGIHSPWQKPEAAKPEELKFDAPISRLEEAPPLPVRFIGQGYNLQVGIVLPKKVKVSEEQAFKFARIVVGAAFKMLFQTFPRSMDIFRAQAIDNKMPLGPKITLELGDLILYAKASSMDPTLALKMTIDRIVLALMEVQSTYPTSKRILTDHHIHTVLRA